MNVYLNNITGYDDALQAKTMSRRQWSPSLRAELINLTRDCVFPDGRLNTIAPKYDEFHSLLKRTLQIGKEHITLLRFIDLSFTVEGLHRGGQDDWDAHAQRFNNRIIRCSTRDKNFEEHGAVSDYYKGKILSIDDAMSLIEHELPQSIEVDGVIYKKDTNGYIREDVYDVQDVKRGLCMLSFPSNFIFKVNLTEFAHVYKMRNENTHANPEVKQLCMMCAQLIHEACDLFDTQLLLDIKN